MARALGSRLTAVRSNPRLDHRPSTCSPRRPDTILPRPPEIHQTIPLPLMDQSLPVIYRPDLLSRRGRSRPRTSGRVKGTNGGGRLNADRST